MRWRSRVGDDPLTTIIEVRFTHFIFWQLVQGIVVYVVFKTLIFPPAPSFTMAPPYRFALFEISLHLFSTALFHAFLPPAFRRLSPIMFLRGLFEVIDGSQPLTFGYRRMVLDTFKLVVFLVSSAVSTSLTIVCICGSLEFVALGLRGFVAGLIYASHYRRWILDFPIVQRGHFSHYRLGVPKAVMKAVKLSSVVYLLTLVVSIFTNYHKGQLVTWDVITEQIDFYLACIAIFTIWELNRNLLQVIFTERLIFAPPIGSIASGTNPTNQLLSVLENVTSIHHMRYLAYYDLYMVSESHVDTWRWAAFFEESGETYRRLIDACLNPLEQLILDLRPPTEPSSRLNEPFYDFQILAWCARIATTLTVRSAKEYRYGVGWFTRSYAHATISTLLSSLLVVESSMGKNSDLQVQSTNQFPTRHAFFLAAASRRRTRRDRIMLYERNSPQYYKAYSIADILRTSIYQIVSVFHKEMVVSSKVGRLQKDWITLGNPLYGSRELLVQKLQSFIEFISN